MSTTNADQLIAELRGRGVQHVKLGIADIDGVLRGKYLSLDKFTSLVAGSAGFCDCIFGWDINDELYDNVQFSCWQKGFPDVAYRLDLTTMRQLPHEHDTPFFLAELVPPEGQRFHPICPRNQLKRVLARAETMGFKVKLGFEYEFFVFDETPHSAREKGYRDLKPFTPGAFGYSVLRSSVHADMHREFIEFCEKMGMGLEGYHTETGPGVLEGAMRPADALEGADRAVLFKTFTKVFFQRRNLMATFMAKWSTQVPGQSGHLHLSLLDAKTGEPVFYDGKGRSGMSRTMDQFVAGQVKHMREIASMISPTVNSYTRLIEGAWAPTAAAWGVDNRTTAIRIIPGSARSQRVEYRLSAADGNPYLVVAAALSCGLEGIEKQMELGDPVVGNAYEVQGKLPVERQLPRNLREGSYFLRQSQAARQWFGDEFVDHYAATREWEARQYERAITDWELQRYFEIV